MSAGLTASRVVTSLKAHRTAVVLALLGLATFGGAYFVTHVLFWNYEAEVLQGVLSDSSGRINSKAVDAALKARFPDGSNLAELTAFTEKLRGKCQLGPNKLITPTGDAVLCTIPISGTLCYSHEVDIFAGVDDKRLLHGLRGGASVSAC